MLPFNNNKRLECDYYSNYSKGNYRISKIWRKNSQKVRKNNSKFKETQKNSHRMINFKNQTIAMKSGKSLEKFLNRKKSEFNLNLLYYLSHNLIINAHKTY